MTFTILSFAIIKLFMQKNTSMRQWMQNNTETMTERSGRLLDRSLKQTQSCMYSTFQAFAIWLQLGLPLTSSFTVYSAKLLSKYEYSPEIVKTSLLLNYGCQQ